MSEETPDNFDYVLAALTDGEITMVKTCCTAHSLTDLATACDDVLQIRHA